MKKILFVIALCFMMIVNAEARPHHFRGHAPAIHHVHHYTTVKHHNSNKVFWNTFAGATIGTIIGGYIVRDSYITYNQRTNIPQNCVTLMNQATGEITTQCSQNGSQIIMVNP